MDRLSRVAAACCQFKKKKMPVGGHFVRKRPPTTFSSIFVLSAEGDWIAGKFNISEDYNMEKSVSEPLGGTYHKQGDYFLLGRRGASEIITGAFMLACVKR